MRKIMKHPDREEIVKMLNEGESIRKVEAYLKKKHPKSKHLHLSTVTLQNFRKQHLQLEGKVLKDIQETVSTKDRQVVEEKRIEILENTNAYQDKINSIADTHLDVANKILRLDGIIESRMEYWYNAINSGEASPSQADKEMRQYMDRQMLLLQQYKKFVEGIADKTIDYNVNVSVMNDQIVLIRDAIRDVLVELDTDKAMLFMDRLSKKIGDLSYLPTQTKERPVSIAQLNSIDAEILEEDENENV